MTRTPSEFMYWEKLESRRIKLVRSIFTRIMGWDLLPSDEVVRKFADSYYQADPVAEAFVDEVYLVRGAAEGRRMLDRAIEHGVDSIPDAPESMRRLFDEFEQIPDWVDMDRVLQGAKIWRNYGPTVFSLAGVSTLEMYSENSIVKPLSLTGSYAGETARRRFMETVKFWIDISEPGGLEPGGPGRATAMRVRVMHVFLRRHLVEHPEWNLEAWGVPISVGDATTTLLAGAVPAGLMLWTHGYQTTIREIEALQHFWKYIGHLVGVQPDWYPDDFRGGVQIMAATMLKRAFKAGRDGKELVESYPVAFRPKPGTSLRRRIYEELHYRVQLGYTGFWLLPTTYRRHNLPNPFPWMVFPLLWWPIVFAFETARRLFPWADRLHDRFARWQRDFWWAQEMGSERAHFAPAESFRR
ncbi:DUF2236 domain-containing protein [Pseudonocardiaceae bacterium YIM PH 21723]|nr:DUF2236 domain-containing protein [Pseudonocardiaceae bacterium YIM PH 21723]